jgi:hypothetical protein
VSTAGLRLSLFGRGLVGYQRVWVRQAIMKGEQREIGRTTRGSGSALCHKRVCCWMRRGGVPVSLPVTRGERKLPEAEIVVCLQTRDIRLQNMLDDGGGIGKPVMSQPIVPLPVSPYGQEPSSASGTKGPLECLNHDEEMHPALLPRGVQVFTAATHRWWCCPGIPDGRDAVPQRT